MKFNFIGNHKNYKSILLSASIVRLVRTLQHFSVSIGPHLGKLNFKKILKCIEEKLRTIIVSLLHLFMKSGKEFLYSF